MTTRRSVLKGALGLAAVGGISLDTAQAKSKKGSQRLSIEQLRKWEALGYGMFIHFGMSTFLQKELPDGTAPATGYAPSRLSTDQWISVARAGMMNNPASDLMRKTPAPALGRARLRLEGRFRPHAVMIRTKHNRQTLINAAKWRALAQKCCILRQVS